MSVRALNPAAVFSGRGSGAPDLVSGQTATGRRDLSVRGQAANHAPGEAKGSPLLR